MNKNWAKSSKSAWDHLDAYNLNKMFDENTFRGKLQREEWNWICSRPIMKNQKILDAGCGNGRYTKFFLDNGAKVISYDFSKNILDLMQENLKYPNLTRVQGDLQFLPFKDDQFDVVLLLDVLHHLETGLIRLCAIKEALRVSKRYIYLDVKNKYNPYLFIKYRKINDQFLRNAYTPYEVARAIEQCGGTIIERKSLGAPIEFIAPYVLFIASKTDQL